MARAAEEDVDTFIIKPYTASMLKQALSAAVVSKLKPSLYAQLIEQGKIARVGLGVTLVPDKIRESFKLEGALILLVLPDSAAQKAGLQSTVYNSDGELIVGDLIVKVDGHEIHGNDDLTAYIENNKKAGDSIEINFIRNNIPQTTTAVLQITAATNLKDSHFVRNRQNFLLDGFKVAAFSSHARFIEKVLGSACAQTESVNRIPALPFCQ